MKNILWMDILKRWWLPDCKFIFSLETHIIHSVNRYTIWIATIVVKNHLMQSSVVVLESKCSDLKLTLSNFEMQSDCVFPRTD